MWHPAASVKGINQRMTEGVSEDVGGKDSPDPLKAFA